MRAALAAALVVCTVAARADAPPSQALLGAAVAAADEERFCDALYLFEALHLRQPSPRALYNAAEVASAAGDRVKALDLYRLTQQRYPKFDKATLVQQRANLTFKEMQRRGPGKACPVRDDVCGDWMLRPTEGGEQCDDGNLVSGDGCDQNCTTTRCGNGIVTAGEECDDGNTTDGDGCDRNCTKSRCGNGVRAGNEVCDDGDLIDGDGCDHTCVPTGCGNGIVTAGEECDDGNTIDGDSCDQCRAGRCGNGIVTGLEQCDDGNAVGGDGCENNCTRTLVKKPLPGIVVAVLSAAAIGGGIGMTVVGNDTVLAAEAARARFVAAEAAFSGDPVGSLSGIDGLRSEVSNAERNAQSVGLPLIGGGAAIITAGAIGLVVGVVFAFTNEDIDGGVL